MIDLITKNWQINDIEAILFDKDGTIQNDHIYWGKLSQCRIRRIIEYFNIDKKYFDDLCVAIGYDGKQKKLIKNGPVGTLSRREVIEFMVLELKKYNIDTDFNKISDIFNEVNKEFLADISPYVELLDEVREFLDKIKSKNIKMALVTSDMVENAGCILKILKLEDYFECVIGKDSCERDKKTGEPALLALMQLGVDKNKTIAIGDAKMDYEMAKNAGLKSCVLVSTGQVEFETLMEYSKFCVKNLEEIEVK